jgi:2-hydroxychromene-2-carboxylate isomerase
VSAGRPSKFIEFFFDFVSPYGWFAAEQIGAIARRFGRGLTWRPILLGVTINQVMGLPPLMQTPLKREYVARDVPRCARYHGLAFNPPRDGTLSPVSAARAVTWARARYPEFTERFVLALFRRYWVESVDITSAHSVADVAASIGLDRADVLRAIDDSEIKSLLKAEVAEALRRDIFGSPFMVVDGEPFWGADRLPMLIEWLERGGW